MDDQSPTEKLLDHIQEIAAKKSAEAGEPMWHAYGEWTPSPITFREIQSYTEEGFYRLPKRRKNRIYRFLLRRQIERLWNRFCLLTFVGAPAVVFVSSAHYLGVAFLFYTVVYILYIAHRVGYLEGYDEGHVGLSDSDTYSPKGISMKFKETLHKKESINPRLKKIQELARKRHLAMLRLGMDKEE